MDEMSALPILELQLSFQRSGSSTTGWRTAERKKGSWIRRCGEHRGDTRTGGGDELEPEPEPADRFGPVVLDFVLAACQGRGRDRPSLADEEERRRNEQAGIEEAEERRLPSPSSARAHAERDVRLVHLQEGQEKCRLRIAFHHIQGEQGEQEETGEKLGEEGAQGHENVGHCSRYVRFWGEFWWENEFTRVEE